MNPDHADQLIGRLVECGKGHRPGIIELGQARDELVRELLHRREKPQSQIVDRDVLLANLTYMESRLPELHARLRGHVKNHKSPHIARLQLDHGAFGICAATVWEAIVMVRAGADDVLIANQLVDPHKRRAAALLAREANVIVNVDDAGDAAGGDAVSHPHPATAAHVNHDADDHQDLPGTRPQHGPHSGVATCQTYMRSFKNGDEIAPDAELKLLDDAEVEGRAYMTSKGVQIIPFSAATQAEMQAAVKPIVDDTIGKLEAKGQPARAIYDGLQKAR